ncbi:MAG: MaoC family dehydratase [Mycobacteriales bacterium]
MPFDTPKQRVLRGAADLLAAEGDLLGASDWLLIDQHMVDQFAAATGDNQWIHVDPVRAATGPFGGTVAQGYLTLSLIPLLSQQIWTVEGASMAVNAGTNKVRFTAPVPVGSRVRLTSTVVSTRQMGSSVHLVLKEQIHLEGRDRAVCTAETVTVVAF